MHISEVSNNRLKGFYTEGIISDRLGAETLQEELAQAIHQLNDHETASRLTVRALVELGCLALLYNSDTTVEAVLPLANDDLGVVYLGTNKPGRLMTDEYLKLHQDQLSHITSHGHTYARTDLDIRVVDPTQSGNLVEAFTPLYETLGFDQADTLEMLADPSRTIAYSTVNDMVISTSMAETEEQEVNGFGTLRLIEITEASTLPEFRGQGHYRAVSGHITEHLVRHYDSGDLDLDVIYGESNTAMPAVIRAGYLNGRRFCYFDRDIFAVGNNHYGFLPQNFKIEDGAEVRPYNDFAVSYVPLNEGGRR